MKMPLALLIGWVMCLSGAGAAARPEPPPPGTFTGDGLTLTLARSGDGYTGTASLGGAAYPLKGALDAAKGLAGTFTAGGSTFTWTAAVEGGVLKFETGGTVYRLAMSDGANPLAKKPEPANPLAEGPVPTNQAAPPGSGALKFTRLSVQDPGINNIEAVSFLIPEGWKVEGGVQWFPDFSILANLLMTITDPETGAQIQFLPIQNMTWIENPVMPMQEGQNYMGNIAWRPTSDVPGIVQALYTQQVLPHLAGVQPAAVEPLGRIEEQVDRAWQGQGKCTARRVRYRFQHQGQAWEEDVFMAVVLTPPATQYGITSWYISSAYSFRAPGGVLDRVEPLMATVVSTCRLSQDWFSGYSYVQSLFRNRMNQGIKDAAALSATISKNNEEIRRMYADAYKERQESQDRISESWGEVIKGVETYVNPYEARPVELPSGYNDVWVSPRGEYLLSNQAGFDPNVGSTVEWRRMEAK